MSRLTLGLCVCGAALCGFIAYDSLNTRSSIALFDDVTYVERLQRYVATQVDARELGLDQEVIIENVFRERDLVDLIFSASELNQVRKGIAISLVAVKPRILLISPGPRSEETDLDRYLELLKRQQDLEEFCYDPTNGLRSHGDILRVIP